MEYKNSFFSDTTKYYINPAEPAAYDCMKIRLRGKIDYAQRVYLIINGQKELMLPERREKVFEYFATTIQLENEPVAYYFEIHVEDEVAYYDMRGVVEKPTEHFYFRVIPGFSTPDWAKGAVMYQIFIDRFCNGDQKNDVLTGEYKYLNQLITHVEDWNAPIEKNDVGRFYGGDFQGVLDKLDYLQNLGIDAIYLNPIFISPSNHKYDTQDYDYVDPHLTGFVHDEGKLLSDSNCDNKDADRYITRIADKENLEASNHFFEMVVKAAHSRGIKVILDGVFNHCGSFHKWMDRERIYENTDGYDKGAYIDEASPYHSYFSFLHEKAWPYNGQYEGWWGYETLPKLNYEGSTALNNEILRIGAKWVSAPFLIDGWRLDVASDLGHSAETNHQFWRDFRKTVKQENKDALILAEQYGDPSSWLLGKEWDSVMNYDAFMEPVSWFLTGMEKHSDDRRTDLLNNEAAFWDSMEWNVANMPTPSVQVAMNELSNHDHSRFLTRTNGKIGRLDTLGSAAAQEGIQKDIMREAVMLQMTWTGSPTVYYGDEAGVCGFTDPDNRRTYPWGQEDQEMLRFHKEMIRIHKTYPEFNEGSIKRLDGEHGLLAYGRFTNGRHSVVLINNTDRTIEKTICVWELGVPMKATMTSLMETWQSGFSVEKKSFHVIDGMLTIRIPAKGGIVLTDKA